MDRSNAPISEREDHGDDDRDMTDESGVQDDGSSAEEESKQRSLQPMKATLPSTFEQK